jgi:hypothetical protein
MRISNLFWGLALAFLGGLLLLDNFNMLPPGVNVWGIFWPVVLIFVGLGTLFGALRSSRRGPAGVTNREAFRLPLDGATSARVRIRHGAGELRLDDQAAPGELVSGSFTGGLDHQLSRDGDMAVLDLRAPSDTLPIILPFDSSSGFNWTLGLSREIALELDMELGASSNHIDLTSLNVRQLRVQSGASSTEIAFPARARQTYARVETGVASVQLRIPPGVAARIRSESGLAGVNIDTGRFPRVNGGYRSPDYDTAENRLELDLETGVGSVSVR